MKKVLITGGAKGIGLETAKKFYENGFLTYVTYLSSDVDSLKKEMPGVTFIKCDVRDMNSIKALYEITGDVDVLVNNAGVCLTKLFTDCTEEDYDYVMDTNLKGAYNMSKTYLPGMVKKQSGSIVNVSSIWGEVGASMEVIYSASKAGLIGLTKALSKEYGPSNIRVNAVAPGFIDTDMNKNVDENARNAFFNETPLGRAGTTKEVADAIFFLADTATFTTGACLMVDGGIAI